MIFKGWDNFYCIKTINKKRERDKELEEVDSIVREQRRKKKKK